MAAVTGQPVVATAFVAARALPSSSLKAPRGVDLACWPAEASRTGPARFASCAALAATALGLARRQQRTRKQSASVARHVAVTGPGWTDELARIFDPREAGPEWQVDLGYRGRPRLRLLLDAEDLAHSYAKALYETTGRWTGPLSEGIIKAVEYGAWGGGEPEDKNPADWRPDQPTFTPPEILTFVGMPSDLIEAVNPAAVCDGYPEDLRKELGNVMLSEDGFFINEALRSLQDDNRLMTWNRPSRLPGGVPRPNALMTQKYYSPGKPVPFRALVARPVLLSQVMGAGSSLKVGDEVEALKPGRFYRKTWLPSMWMKAQVLAANYDGTYDLQFERKHGPYREQRTKGLKDVPTLSLKKNEVFKDFGADHMPASFRLMQEMDYAQAVPASQIRLPGMLDRVSDTHDSEAAQDWYLCTSRSFLMTASGRGDEVRRLDDFSRQFVFDYRWVPSKDGLRFEPNPNPTQAQSLRACHNDVAQQFANAASADEAAQRRLEKYKEEMADFETAIGELKAREDKPKRPAGPRGRGTYQEKPQPVRVS